jgi:hypothetical protein
MERKLSRRNVLALGAAGAVAVTGTLLSKGNVLGSSVTESVYGDCNDIENAACIREIAEEVVQEYTQPFTTQLADMQKRLGLVVNVKDFGAAGDGVTDDTAALQNAFNHLATLPTNNRKVLYIPSGKYMFTSLVVNVSMLTVKSDGFYGVSLACTDTTSTPAIHIKGASWQFDGINLEGVEGDVVGMGKTGILFKRDVGKYPDIDSEFINCRINNFNIGVEFWGRGLKMQGCLMANNGYCVNLEWMNVGDYLPAKDPNNPTQQDITGFRHYSFIGCRFHSEVNGAIKNTGVNASKINGIVVVGCNMDIGKVLWTGVLRDALLASNSITQTPYNAFDLHSGSRDYLIADTIIAGETLSEPDRTPVNFIIIRGNHQNGVFRNLLLKNCRQHGINVRNDGVSTNMVFENITFVEPCLTGGAYNPITFVGPSHTAVVRNITFQRTGALTGVIKTTDATADIQVDGVYKFENTTPTMTGAGTKNVKRFHVLDGFDRIDLVGSGSPEGVVAAHAGSTYRRVDGGAGTTFYVKESGSGNTGWAAK